MSEDTRDLLGCGCIVGLVTLWLLLLYLGLLLIGRLFG